MTQHGLSTQKAMEQEQELLIHVDSANQVLGSVGKITAHQNEGILHRAFTVFLQNNKGQLLVTQRSTYKPLWPLWWDAACSSHQWYPDESAVAAVQRRLPFEIGISSADVTNLQEHFSFEYHAVYSPEWSENEVNSIVVGAYTGECQLNEHQVAEYEWLDVAGIAAQLAQSPPRYAPWFPLAWQGLLNRGIISL